MPDLRVLRSKPGTVDLPSGTWTWHMQQVAERPSGAVVSNELVCWGPGGPGDTMRVPLFTAELDLTNEQVAELATNPYERRLHYEGLDILATRPPRDQSQIRLRVSRLGSLGVKCFNDDIPIGHLSRDLLGRMGHLAES